MADIPFALHLLTSASTGGFWWGKGGLLGRTTFTPEAGTQAETAGTPLPLGSPITTCRGDPLMEIKD